MKRTCIKLALLVGLGACGDDAAPPPEPDASIVTRAPETRAPVEADAGLSPGDAQQPEAPRIPLILWVDDLVEHHTTERSLPDTVAEKRIMGTDDPRLFDKYFD